MKKRLTLLLCAVALYVLFAVCAACSNIYYPELPNATIGNEPIKGVEVYCWQDEGKWECGATLGTNRMKSDKEIRALHVVSLSQMKKILENKNLTDYAYIVLIDLSGNEVVYLTSEEYSDQYGWLELHLGLS
ncbi:MAG: hypothetical protein IJX87_06450 [Clostridia bacterium]|nr:hypothetical protein [Clostridia bacterium]